MKITRLKYIYKVIQLTQLFAQIHYRQVPEPTLAAHFDSHNFYKSSFEVKSIRKIVMRSLSNLTHQGMIEVPALRKKVIMNYMNNKCISYYTAGE
jgi:hypothetical protein